MIEVCWRRNEDRVMLMQVWVIEDDGDVLMEKWGRRCADGGMRKENDGGMKIEVCWWRNENRDVLMHRNEDGGVLIKVWQWRMMEMWWRYEDKDVLMEKRGWRCAGGGLRMEDDEGVLMEQWGWKSADGGKFLGSNSGATDCVLYSDRHCRGLKVELFLEITVIIAAHRGRGNSAWKAEDLVINIVGIFGSVTWDPLDSGFL